MPKQNKTKAERIVTALEYSALLWFEWKFNKKGYDPYRLLFLFYEMSSGSSEYPEAEALERNLRNCLRDLEDELDIQVSLKKKSIECSSSDSAEDLTFSVLSFYLRSAFEEGAGEHNDFLIRRFCRYRFFFGEKQTEEDFLMSSLYLFVYIRYSMMHKIKMDCSYKKMMSAEKSERRLVPLYLAADSAYLTLVALDVKDKNEKQFILANLFLKEKISVLREYEKLKEKPEKFNYKKYKKTDLGRFQRETVRYRIRITQFSLEHWILNSDISLKITEDEGYWKTVEVESSDELEIQKASFIYNKYFIILSSEP